MKKSRGAKRQKAFDKFVEREMKKEKRRKLFAEYKKFEGKELLKSVTKVYKEEKPLKPREHSDSPEPMEVEAKSEAEVFIEKEPEPANAQQNKRKRRKKKSDSVFVEPEAPEITQPTPELPAVAEVPQKSFFVTVNRLPEIEDVRQKLPVVGEEQQIMEAIASNDVVVICGETGSGKTTQIPQFLFEAGFGHSEHPKFKGMVGVTQPRRVAAVSMANRVAEELQEIDGLVSYQIRYDRQLTSLKTRIKFMTDGILLRELSGIVKNKGDLLLSKYSCIIIDEAHERTVGTDILIGWLSRIVSLRNSGKVKGVGPLKLVIMSATLNVKDFTENHILFPPKNGLPPPVVKVEGRQHKVVIHYNKITPELDYISDVVKKVCKIHKKLPAGGILVFVTGQQEVKIICKKLSDIFKKKQTCFNQTDKQESTIFDEDQNDVFDNLTEYDDYDLEDESETESVEEEDVEVLNGNVEDEQDLIEEPNPDLDILILPLYSMLSTNDQMKIFQPMDSNTRLVVVATNIAETSITIPSIRYVIDTGKVKQREYDTQTGIQNFRISWTSAASANQRAGRAGRTGPGHCYRLYSSNVFYTFFQKFTKPEIDRIPIEGVVLSMKAMGINNVVGFPFPTPPNVDHLKDAEKLLKILEALDDDGKITKIGIEMNKYPVGPRYAKMLVVATFQKAKILNYIIAIVAGMTVGNLFLRDVESAPAQSKIESDDEQSETNDKEQRSQERSKFFKKMMQFGGINPTSDALAILRAMGAYHNFSTKNHISQTEQFCKENFLRQKSMEESVKLYEQLLKITSVSMNQKVTETLVPPSNEEEVLIRQVILSGFPDNVATLDLTSEFSHGKHGLPVYQTSWGLENEYFVISNQSALSRIRPAPQWIIFDHVSARQEITGIQNELLDLRNKGSQRKYLQNVTIIDSKWIVDQCKEMVSFGSLLEQPVPKYKNKTGKVVGFYSPTYGMKLWPLGICEKALDNHSSIPYFATALLEGVIDIWNRKEDNLFKICSDLLVAKPTIISKSWARTQKRVEGILRELQVANVTNKEALLMKWKENSQFLLQSYLLWIPEQLHPGITRLWPPVEFRNGKIKHKPELIELVTKLKGQQ